MIVLYISAADIADDDLYTNEEESPFYQDAAILFIDPRPVNLPHVVTESNLFKDWIAIAISPIGEGLIYAKHRLPRNTTCKLKITENGYHVEARIPITYFNEGQGKNWADFRFNLLINDYDQNGHHQTRVGWKPTWTEEGNYLGSGSFVKK